MTAYDPRDAWPQYVPQASDDPFVGGPNFADDPTLVQASGTTQRRGYPHDEDLPWTCPNGHQQPAQRTFCHVCEADRPADLDGGQ
jgi:hypothetical protein